MSTQAKVARPANHRMRSPRILVVDDDPLITKFLGASLKAQGWDVLIAMSGAEALDTVETELPDLVILDIMMPKLDGFDVCLRLRQWSEIPIIMLSAKSDASDKARCLNIGADDYITKPFALGELIARVKSVLRRVETPRGMPTQSSFSKGDIKIDLAQRQITPAGNEVKLTPTEYVLLHELMTNAGKVLTHSHLLSRVWGPEYIDDREYLHVFISRLRAKIESDSTNPKYIVTVPGVGYMFKDTG